MQGGENMFIVDKNNIPEDIVNDDARFDETTYLLIHQYQLQVNELEDYFQKYNKPCDLEGLLKKNHDFKRYFEDLDSRSLKAYNSTFIRYFIKDLKKKVTFKSMGQNNVKRKISILIGDIVLESCYICFQNLFREKYMDLFEATMESDHLHDEFEEMVIQLFQPMWDGISDEMSDKLYAKLILYRKIHGKYLVELALDHPDYEKLSEYKKQIQDIIEMDENEADKKATAMEKEEDEKEKKLNLLFKDYIEQKDVNKVDEINKYIENDEPRINDDYNVMEIVEQTDVIEENKPVRNEDRLKKTYQQYFLYDQDEYSSYKDNICKIDIKLSYAVDTNSTSFIDFLYVFYIANMTEKIEDQLKVLLNINDCRSEITDQINDFIFLLSYYLWNTGNEENSLKRIDGFQKIIDEIPECHQMFLCLRDDLQSEDYIESDSSIDFTPLHLYYNHLVVAVIFNMDIPAVSRRLKSLILTSYESFDLMEKSKYYTKMYNEHISKDDFNSLHECADLFVLSYLKDKRYIASFSPFLRYCYECYNEICDYGLHDETQTIIYLHEQIDFDLKYKKKLIQIKNNFDLLLDEIHNYQGKLILNKFNKIEEIMNISEKSICYFNPIGNKDNILKKYKYRLITYIANNTNNFFEQSLNEKTDQLLCICLLYHYIDTIEQYEQYMPRKQQLLNEEYIQSLKSIIEDKEHIIDIKNKQIDHFNSKKKTKKKNRDHKLYEEEIKYYKQELSILNKQLKNKDLEIANLKKNQTELYKLRELMFEM